MRGGGRNNGWDNADNVTSADNARDPGDKTAEISTVTRRERDGNQITSDHRKLPANCRAHSVGLHIIASNLISSHFAFGKSYYIILNNL